ncbi:hypothetical protein QBC39DRAFT_151166 [Podospora conica]|nr:hypothetical protein QBC39DRAFT_151166 [Schizothecium conicum]
MGTKPQNQHFSPTTQNTKDQKKDALRRASLPFEPVSLRSSHFWGREPRTNRRHSLDVARQGALLRMLIGQVRAEAARPVSPPRIPIRSLDALVRSGPNDASWWAATTLMTGEEEGPYTGMLAFHVDGTTGITMMFNLIDIERFKLHMKTPLVEAMCCVDSVEVPSPGLQALDARARGMCSLDPGVSTEQWASGCAGYVGSFAKPSSGIAPSMGFIPPWVPVAPLPLLSFST